MKLADKISRPGIALKQTRWPGWLPPATKPGVMCHKCSEIDNTILRYRNIQRRVLDQKMIEGAQNLIDELEAKKLEYHSNDQNSV